MNKLSVYAALFLLTACSTTNVAVDQNPVRQVPASYAGNDAQLAKTILKDSIGYATVEGRGHVPELATYYASVLKNAGFSDSDITITPYQDTAMLSATLHGRDDTKPLLVIGHMDVVEANPADWERDPFTAIEENGYFFN